ncbi:MAG: hypothetical protein ACFCVG_04695 [Kineosporiaceae bacterium]
MAGLYAAVWGCPAAVALYGVVAFQLVRLGAVRRPAAVPTAAWAALLTAVAATDAAAGTAWLGILLALGFAVQVTPAVRRGWAEPVPTGISPTTWLLTLMSVALWGSTVRSTATPAEPSRLPRSPLPDRVVRACPPS